MYHAKWFKGIEELEKYSNEIEAQGYSVVDTNVTDMGRIFVIYHKE